MEQLMRHALRTKRRIDRLVGWCLLVVGLGIGTTAMMSDPTGIADGRDIVTVVLTLAGVLMLTRDLR